MSDSIVSQSILSCISYVYKTDCEGKTTQEWCFQSTFPETSAKPLEGQDLIHRSLISYARENEMKSEELKQKLVLSEGEHKASKVMYSRTITQLEEQLEKSNSDRVCALEELRLLRLQKTDVITDEHTKRKKNTVSKVMLCKNEPVNKKPRFNWTPSGDLTSDVE